MRRCQKIATLCAKRSAKRPYRRAACYCATAPPFLQKSRLKPRCPPSLRKPGSKFSRQIVNTLAVGWQFGLSPERRSGFLSHRLLGLLALKRLPTLDEPKPKRPVAGIARSGS
jgi:hypothetical protein